ncbi:MAG: hypothetical protein IS632_07530 [Thaumarchaeota archaeon]|nr:hypothetical protein [Nitrososphaerota archaeon]
MGYLDTARNMDRCAAEARELGEHDIASSFSRIATLFRQAHDVSDSD